jgi:DNA recombination protein RmuC
MSSDQVNAVFGPFSLALTGFSVGVILCIVLFFAIVHSMRRKWQHETEKSEQDLAVIKQINGELEQKLRHQGELIHSMEKDAIILEQQFSAAQSIWQEKEAMLQSQKRQMQVEFKQLAQDILQQQQQRLAAENEKQLGSLLNPLEIQIKHFQQKVEMSYQAEAKERFSLVKEIKNLQQLNQRISDDAAGLTQALKGQNKIQGGWGEVILERVLERSGLEKGREYQVQVSTTTETGRRLQPDVIVNLPEGKQIIIDSKMVLISYLAYVEAETEDEKQKALKQHLDAIKRHIKDLSGKAYETLPGISTLDFVLLFIPIEAAYLLAIQADANVFSDAFDKNIIVVGPSNLLATLRTIQNIWRNEKQSQNAVEIAKQAGAMYDKFVGFVADMDEVGNRLNMARRGYDSAMNKLNSGKGNLVGRAQQLKVMGAKTNKQLPSSHLDESQASLAIDGAKPE